MHSSSKTSVLVASLLLVGLPSKGGSRQERLSITPERITGWYQLTVSAWEPSEYTYDDAFLALPEAVALTLEQAPDYDRAESSSSLDALSLSAPPRHIFLIRSASPAAGCTGYEHPVRLWSITGDGRVVLMFSNGLSQLVVYLHAERGRLVGVGMTSWDTTRPDLVCQVVATPCHSCRPRLGVASLMWWKKERPYPPGA